MKQTVCDIPLLWRTSAPFQLRVTTRRLRRTKSVEALKSTGYVSPLYCSLKNDANVRPENGVSSLVWISVSWGARTQYRVLDEVIIRVVEFNVVCASCSKSGRAEVI